MAQIKRDQKQQVANIQVTQRKIPAVEQDHKISLIAISGNFVALYSSATHQSSIFDIEISNDKKEKYVGAKPLAVFGGNVKTFIVHNNHLICDGEVFEFSESGISLLQSLPEYHHTGVIGMTEDYLVFA